MGELDGFGLADFLPPERTAHAVHDTLRVRHEGYGRGAGGELRDVELSPVVAVRQVDLFEHRLPRGPRRRARQTGQRRSQQQAPHARTAASASSNDFFSISTASSISAFETDSGGMNRTVL